MPWRKLAMGPAVRVTLRFDSVFWEDPKVMGERALRDPHFIFSDDPGFPTWWTGAPQHLPVLVGWCAGPCAEAKASIDEGQLCSEAYRPSREFFLCRRALSPSRLTHFYYHDWQSDPYSRGAYSYVLAGGMGAQQELARPLANRLFFAGEATQSDGHHATVHGAFSSGVRVAKEILRVFGSLESRCSVAAGGGCEFARPRLLLHPGGIEEVQDSEDHPAPQSNTNGKREHNRKQQQNRQKHRSHYHRLIRLAAGQSTQNPEPMLQHLLRSNHLYSGCNFTAH